MPRQSRIDAPGALHHVMIRGIERTAIFRDDRDRDSFLDRFGDILLESSTPCYAWSLLSNHAHFLLRTGKIPIALVMRRLLLEKVSGHFGVDSEDLKSGSKARNVAKARAVLCYVGVRKVGLTSASVAKELGMSPSAVSKLIVRAKQVSGHEDIEGNFL